MLRRLSKKLAVLCLTAALSSAAYASEFHGQVTYAGQPVPGVTVTATQGTKKVTAVTDQQGVYSFPDLADGAWHIEMAMTLFEVKSQDVTVAPNMPFLKWELKLLPQDQVLAKATLQKPDAVPAPSATTVAANVPSGKKGESKPGEAPAETPKSEEADKSADALLINGSQNNAASSTFTTAPAFGNQRKGAKGLYNGSFGVTYQNSALNARPYSFTGLDTSQPSYNLVTGVATFGGPINIPHFWRRGPNFFVAYQWTRNNNNTILPGIVPTAAQRALPGTAAAEQLLQLYPLPNVTGNSRYNYQVQQLNATHQDSMQSRLDKTIGNRNQVYGSFAFQSTRSDSSNLFNFRDTNAALGLNSSVNWVHRWHHGIVTNTGVRFSRLRALSTPFCAGNNDPRCASVPGAVTLAPYAGPPNLSFTNISSFSDGQYAFNRNRTTGITSSNNWNHGRHYVSFGGDFSRRENNDLQQQNARGTFTFTGANDFANFLAGNPDTTAIDYGNPDKYLRQSVYDLFVTDDWRIRPDLTLNVGVRWEYGAPISELKGRLANLDISPGFKTATTVVGYAPKGPLTGVNYPSSLMFADRNSIQPRVGVSWRPIPGSSLVVRAGYGVYQDTSVYGATALALAQQPRAPFDNVVHAFSLDRATCPQTLTSGFTCSSSSTFAVDPNFRVGYAHSWQLAVQRDLPGALQLTATYLGIKGTRGVQEFLPNTYPVGATDPCPSCPSGFIYRTSNGNSTRNAGTVQLRRRLRSGFTATVNYTWAKALDNDSQLGGQGPVQAGGTTTGSALSANTSGVTIAQNWLDLRAERSLSSFDQRHLVTATVQYTSGQGLHGGSLMTGWRGRVLKEWTVVNNFTAGTGLPETPIYLAVVPGTGVTGTIRPNVTGAPINAAPAGYFVNPAAFSAPAPGQWGNARRYSITGPSQFTWNASLQRTFRLDKRYSLDARVDATNVLNHVNFSSYNTVFNSTQFGLPVSANGMRSLEANARVRF